MVAGPATARRPDLTNFDFEQRMFYEMGEVVKDHCLIRVGAVYHLFYLRGDPAINVGHATSEDLIHWTMKPPVLDIDPNAWDNLAMWAPNIINDANGNWIMYYTGVNNFWSQQAGIALSADLENWVKLPWPVYHPDENAWAYWSIDTWSHGRDPFVFEHDGMFYMLNTALNWRAKGCVALASSPDRFNWTDIGPLYVHDSWHVLESLQWLDYQGRYHLFFTEEVVHGTSHMSSADPLSGFDISNRVVIDLGHAPEINQFDPDEFVFSRHSIHQYYDEGQNGEFVIRFDSLVWAGPNAFVYKAWPLAPDWTLQWGNAFLFAPTFLNNPAARGEQVDVGYVDGNWLSSYERYQGVLGVGRSGDIGGDDQTGLIRSRTFEIFGNSINLLVGGGDFPATCNVKLIDASNQQVLFSETGNGTDEMDRRFWDLRTHVGKDVYLEVLDNSTEPGGHISCDDIRESWSVVSDDPPPGDDDGRRKWDFVDRPDKKDATLQQNNPNPFNPTTTISFYLPESAHVTLNIFDVGGQRVRQLVSKAEAEGTHSVTWDGRNDVGAELSTGIYFYRLLVGGSTIDTKKMMLLK